MTNWLKSAAIVAALLAATTMTACGSDDEGSSSGPSTTAASGEGSDDSDPLAPQPLAEKTTVTASIPFRGIEPYATLLLADAFGEFEKENIELEIVEQQTNEAVVLLQRGDVDFMPAAVSAGLYNAIAGGADIRVVGGGIGFTEDNKQGYYVSKAFLDGKEFDPCDLEGENVSTGSATGIGSPAVVELAALLDECDLGLDDVNIVPQGGGDLFAAMQTGAVAAGNLADPFWQQAEERGDELIAPFTQPNAGYYMGKIRTEQPEVAEAIIRALVRTTRTYLQDDYRANDEVKQAMVEEMGIDEASLEGPATIVFDPDFEFPVEVVAPVEEVWLGEGGILNYDEALPVEDYFDDSLRASVVG